MSSAAKSRSFHVGCSSSPPPCNFSCGTRVCGLAAQGRYVLRTYHDGHAASRSGTVCANSHEGTTSTCTLQKANPLRRSHHSLFQDINDSRAQGMCLALEVKRNTLQTVFVLRKSFRGLSLHRPHRTHSTQPFGCLLCLCPTQPPF